MAISKMNDAKVLVLGLIMHANDNGEQTATNLDQLEPYLRNNTPALTGTNQFELVFQGSLQDIRYSGQTIVLREKQAWQAPNGGWLKAYSFADGHSEIHKTDDGDFDSWEKQHMFSPAPAGQ